MDRRIFHLQNYAKPYKVGASPIVYMLHRLKTWPGGFRAIVAGEKTHEVRKIQDRHFAVGDLLLLQEWVPCPACQAAGGDCSTCQGQGTLVGYTGQELLVKVTYITAPGDWGMAADSCVMSIRRS